MADKEIRSLQTTFGRGMEVGYLKEPLSVNINRENCQDYREDCHDYWENCQDL